MRKKLLSILLAVFMVMTSAPASVFATEPGSSPTPIDEVSFEYTDFNFSDFTFELPKAPDGAKYVVDSDNYQIGLTKGSELVYNYNNASKQWEEWGGSEYVSVSGLPDISKIDKAFINFKLITTDDNTFAENTVKVFAEKGTSSKELNATKGIFIEGFDLKNNKKIECNLLFEPRHSITVTFDPEYLGYCSLQVDGQSTSKYDGILLGSSIKLSVASIFPDFQLDRFYSSEISNDNVTVDGNSISFTMPDKDIGIDFYCSKAVSNVDLSAAFPKIGDDSMATPTINSGTNYRVTDTMVLDMSGIDPLPVDGDNKIAGGKKYLACITLYTNDGYTFKCDGSLLDENYEYKYTSLDVKVNGKQISAWQSDTDTDETGYSGSRDDDHDHITIYYYFSLYEVTEGDDAIIDVSLGKPAVFRSTADKNKFVKVTINDVDLGSSNYDVTEGSTIVTLKPSYLSTLANGIYNISIISTDGYADAQFTITGNAPTPGPTPGYKIPKTGVE